MKEKELVPQLSDPEGSEIFYVKLCTEECFVIYYSSIIVYLTVIYTLNIIIYSCVT